MIIIKLVVLVPLLGCFALSNLNLASWFYYGYYITLFYFISSLYDAWSIFHESWADYGAILLSLIVVVVAVVAVVVVAAAVVVVVVVVVVV